MKRNIYNLDLIAIALLIAIKLFLVTPALSPASLYRDDAWQALAVRLEHPKDVLIVGVTAPGFATALRFIDQPSNHSSFILQFPALFAGILGPILVFGLARWWGLSWPTALLAATLLCVAPTHTEYASRVKPYTADACSTLMVLFLAKRACDQPTDQTAWAALAGFSAFGFVCSATAGLAGFAMVLAVGGSRFTQRFKQPFTYWLTGLCYLSIVVCWYTLVLKPNSNDALHEFWEGRFVSLHAGPIAAVKSLAANFLRVFAGLIPIKTNFVRAPLALIYVLTAASGWIAISRKNWGYGYVLAAPLILAVLLCILGKYPLGGGRTDLYLAPLQVFLIAASVEWISSRRYTPWLVGCLCAILVSLACQNSRATYPRENMQLLTRSIEQQAGAEDKILVLPETSYMYALYSQAKVSIHRDPLSMTGFTPALSDKRVATMPGFEFIEDSPIFQRGKEVCRSRVKNAMLASPQNIWLVASVYFPDKLLPELEKQLQSNGWQLKQELEFENVKATCWSRP